MKKRNIFLGLALMHSVLRVAMIWIKCLKEYCLRPNPFRSTGEMRNYLDQYRPLL